MAKTNRTPMGLVKSQISVPFYLVLISAFGLLLFLASSSIAPLKSQLLSSLFPKDSSFAMGANGSAKNSKTVPSIELVTPNPVPSSWPALGLKVNFSIVYGTVKNPRIQVRCYQATDPSGYAMHTDQGYLVYAEARGATSDQGDYIGTNPIVLGGGSSAWLMNKGSAECTADLFYFGKQNGQETFNALASTKPFTANAQ